MYTTVAGEEAKERLIMGWRLGDLKREREREKQRWSSVSARGKERQEVCDCWQKRDLDPPSVCKMV